MPFIRRIYIQNFRCIRSLCWHPEAGFNCLIGAGDSGKSTVLEAIDWCLSQRYQLKVSDADFYGMNVEQPIRISAVLGNLEPSLAERNRYGRYLNGWNAASRELFDEPAGDLELALTLELLIDADLDPQWRLRSNRADPDEPRGVAGRQRPLLEPVRIGSYSGLHLGWQRGSILTRLTGEAISASTALAEASRAARASFGDAADAQLNTTLDIVRRAADQVGIRDAEGLGVALDARAVTVSGGSLAVHDASGVPFRNLGLGSSRLLVAELQRAAGASAPIALVDEVEQGLEPHRIARFLVALGSKAAECTQQVFMTTHSPAVLRELNASQLHVLERERTCENGSHTVRRSDNDDHQGTLRTYADAFLGRRILVCEGATEVGFVRGIDRYFADARGGPSCASEGTVPIDAHGEKNLYNSTPTFLSLNYEVASFRDDDTGDAIRGEQEFIEKGGRLLKWPSGQSIEDAIFTCVSAGAAVALVKYVEEDRGQAQVRSDLAVFVKPLPPTDDWLAALDDNKRKQLAETAGKFRWFKQTTLMEEATYCIICPDLESSVNHVLCQTIDEVLDWAVPNRATSAP